MNQLAQEALTPEETKRLEKTQQVVLALEKCTRAQKLYNTNNQIIIQHKEILNNAFNAYLKEHAELVLTVKPTSFLFLGKTVYQNENKKESFAFRLYNEGMRAIRFTEGLSSQELDDFMQLLNSVTLDSGSMDGVSTLLWEKEFNNITYEIAQYVMDDEESDNISGKVEEILDPKMAHYLGPISSGPPEDIEEGIDLETLIPTTDFKKLAKEICVLDAKEFEQIQREIVHGERHERLMLDLFDILVTLVLEEKDTKALPKLYQVLLETIDASVLHGELQVTGQLLWALRGMLEGGTGDFSMRHPDRILTVIESLGNEDRITRYLTSLNLGFTGSVKDIVNFFASLPKRAFPILLNHIHIVSSPQLRKEISIATAQIYDFEIEHFNKAFKTIKNPQHLIDVLFILSHTRDKRAVPFLQPLFNNSNRNVRLSTINILKDLDAKESSQYLLNLVEDSDAEIRMSAIRNLSNSTDTNVGKLFLEKIKANEFSQLHLQEKRNYFFSTAKILKDEFIPELKGFLSTRSLFRKQQIDDLYQCAAHALGVIGSDAAIETLKEFEQNGNKLVKQHCARELRRGSHGGAHS